MNSHLTVLSFGYVALAAFWTVLIVELVGDKSLYSITSLSLRFPAATVLTGVTLAFALKMLAAVLLARLLVLLHFWTDVLSAVAFFLSGLFVWFQRPESTKATILGNSGWWRSVALSFAPVFLNEWGDPSQIALAALAAKSHLLLAPWLGGTLAMGTKGGLALLVGVKLRDHLPHRTLRAFATASFAILGILALRRLIFP